MSLLYEIFILPIEIIYRAIYLGSVQLTGNYGLSILVLSAVSAVAFIPLGRLAVGMQAGSSNVAFGRNNHIDLYPSGFLRPLNQFSGNVRSSSPRLFYAGTVTAPKNIGESINEGIAAAYQVAQTLNAAKS